MALLEPHVRISYTSAVQIVILVFSEDVDLILDWRLIGYGTDEPWEPRSNTRQNKFKLETFERINC